MFKKQSLLACLFVGIAQCIQGSQATISLAQATPVSAPLVADYSTGQAKIKQWIDQVVNTHIVSLHPAKTLNLKGDLDLADIAKTFGCKTFMGTWFLEETFARPLTAQDRETVLAQRRAVIEYLITHPEQKREIEELLNLVQHYEQDLIQVMSDYFKGVTCPEILGLAVTKQAMPAMYPVSEFLELNPTGRFVKTALAGAGTTAAGTLVVFHALNGDLGSAALFGFLGGFDGYLLYKEYDTAYEKRLKMHALNRIIDVAEKCEALCAKHNIQTQFKISAINDTIALEIIEKLKHSRYQHKDTKMFMTPLVHALLYKIYQNEQCFAQLFANIAEMDAYNAIANKIIESHDKESKFCFATIVDSDKPSVKAHGFWNVLVANPVVNTIAEDKNIILTGPNAGGKTTAIRALLQNIIFAQTFGIAAAETFEYTMCDVIESYLHISDDLINGDSHFKAEVKRAQSVLAKIKQLAPGEKYFFALDELFTGTVAEDGEECAYNFVQRLNQFDNIQCIYATHFKRVKEIANTNPRCANYKVDAPTRNAAGALVYPFTLSAGASTVHIGIEIAKDAGLFA